MQKDPIKKAMTHTSNRLEFAFNVDEFAWSRQTFAAHLKYFALYSCLDLISALADYIQRLERGASGSFVVDFRQ